MKVEQITITPDESMLFNIKQESKDENQIDQENSCQDMFDYNDDSESELIKSESKNESKNSGFSEETATFSCKHCNENFDEARWAPCTLKWKNILPQIRLFVLVRPSSPPYTAHLFIFELFVPILPRIQLI